MTIEICVVGLQQQLPDSRACAELQASSVAAANVLKLTGEAWPADQFDQVPKPVVEPGEIGRDSIAQERSIEARFSVSSPPKIQAIPQTPVFEPGLNRSSRL